MTTHKKTSIDINTRHGMANQASAYLVIYAADGIGVAADILPTEPPPVYVVGKGMPYSVLCLRGPNFEAARAQMRTILHAALKDEASPLVFRQ